jgi:hypothetical protein
MHARMVWIAIVLWLPEGTFGDGLGAVIEKRETLLMTSLTLMKERLKPSWPTGCTSPRG